MWKQTNSLFKLPKSDIAEVIDDVTQFKKHTVGINLHLYYQKLVKQLILYRDKVRMLEQQNTVNQDNINKDINYDKLVQENKGLKEKIDLLEHEIRETRKKLSTIDNDSKPTTKIDTEKKDHQLSDANQHTSVLEAESEIVYVNVEEYEINEQGEPGQKYVPNQ